VNVPCFCYLARLYLRMRYPLEKLRTWSTLYELGYMGSFFFTQIHAVAALGGVILGVQQLQIQYRMEWMGWVRLDDGMWHAQAFSALLRCLDVTVRTG
jgi:hypothetical protein